ncbi:hypothetical protein BDV98DRAFT_599678 [Pterulicium gracile]|uniref:Major facilitator superfamily (MFS) profile domain-containing protein n=1 Tax=Pterulicium gracile TaxID=1884261 RepID=A0A5C3R1A9_9AGAR|nr:hypothetical protein BDV98DRAFT_599678 [Pterula gracilis]
MSNEIQEDRKSNFADEERQENVGRMTTNANAKIQNPLHGLSKEALLKRVSNFCTEKGFEDKLELFTKAALLAQNPKDLETIEELTEEDRVAIRREVTHKWSQSRDLYKTVIICSLSAAVQGWDQTGSNGANLSFPQEFGISNDDPNPERNQWIVGLVNSAPYIAVALCSAWLTDPINHYLGRRGTLFFSAVFCTFSVIGSALSRTWEQLFITRLLLGLGMGPKACTSPVFAAENTPASIRGGLVMSWQLWTAFGIMLGYIANLVLMDIGPRAWRYQLGSAFIPAVPLLIGIYFCPESPRWYMMKNRYPDAFRSFCRLRVTELQAARDMFYVHSQLVEELELAGGRNYVNRFVDLFTVPRIRRASLASFVVMIGQQMCGVNIISFYSATIFSEAGYSARNALLASFGTGLVNWVFAFPAVFTIDRWGRRNLLLFTFPQMAWTLLATGLAFYMPESNAARVPLIAFFIYLFMAFYSPGEGPVPFTYSAEVFPLTHRDLGMGYAVATNMFWAAVLALTFPRMLRAMTFMGAFGFYAGLNMTAFVMIFFLVPETKQRTLEELDYVFAVPTSKHAAYQSKEMLPYFIKRYIFMRKDATVRPLYNFDEVESITVFEKGAAH